MAIIIVGFLRSRKLFSLPRFTAWAVIQSAKHSSSHLNDLSSPIYQRPPSLLSSSLPTPFPDKQDQSESLSLFLSSPNSYTSHSPPNSSSTTQNPSGGEDQQPPNDLPKPELVFSSPFYRCIQTAEPTAQKLGVAVRLEHGVSEWLVGVVVLPSSSGLPRWEKEIAALC